jgi:phosphopantetheine adenylyltransferase
MNYLVIYPGRFHPFHLGHKASYDWLIQQFGENSVYVASSGKQEAETSPFAYADKVKMATKLGVPAGRIKQVKNPYQATEITKALSDQEKANTVLVFAVSAKDAQRFDYRPKANGSPAYLQPLPEDEKGIKPMTQHGYVVVTPTVNFRVQGADANSASQIRKLYTAGNDNDRDQIIVDLYGVADSELRDVFDQALGVNKPQEGIIYGQEAVFAGDNPVNIMRENRLDQLKENILYLQHRLQLLRDGMDYIDEKWSGKYKRSINCARPRGFSQKAHCAGRKKK